MHKFGVILLINITSLSSALWKVFTIYAPLSRSPAHEGGSSRYSLNTLLMQPDSATAPEIQDVQLYHHLVNILFFYIHVSTNHFANVIIKFCKNIFMFGWYLIFVQEK